MERGLHARQADMGPSYRHALAGSRRDSAQTSTATTPPGLPSVRFMNLLFCRYFAVVRALSQCSRLESRATAAGRPQGRSSKTMSCARGASKETHQIPAFHYHSGQLGMLYDLCHSTKLTFVLAGCDHDPVSPQDLPLAPLKHGLDASFQAHECDSSATSGLLSLKALLWTPERLSQRQMLTPDAAITLADYYTATFLVLCCYCALHFVRDGRRF